MENDDSDDDIDDIGDIGFDDGKPQQELMMAMR